MKHLLSGSLLVEPRLGSELFKHTIYAIINLYPDWSTTFIYRDLMRCITAMQYFPTMLFEPWKNTNIYSLRWGSMGNVKMSRL